MLYIFKINEKQNNDVFFFDSVIVPGAVSLWNSKWLILLWVTWKIRQMYIF